MGAQILTFPSPPNAPQPPPSVVPFPITAREGDVLTLGFSGGDILYFPAYGQARALEPWQAIALRDLYGNEARDAYIARAVAPARKAARLYRELVNALDRLADWNACVGKPSPYEDAVEEARRRLTLAAEIAVSTPTDPPGAA